MTQQATREQAIEQGGLLIGEYRRPANRGQGQAGSIHDDETAQGLGFRGGTIAGSTHMAQFPPALMEVLGQQWFETGSLSLYFRNATISEEAVRTLVQRPEASDPNAQVNVWMERDDGMLVSEGTASVGTPSEPSALRKRLSELHPPGTVRILEHLSPGMEMASLPARVESEGVEERLAGITEPLDWYSGGSPWGGPILTPSQAVQALRRPEAGVNKFRDGGVVGLFGAIELRHVNGPIFLDHDYASSGRVIAVGETPKSEYYWYESWFDEPDGGKRVAEMIMMLRFMKASSDLYKDG